MIVKTYFKKILSNFLGVEILNNLSRWRRYRKFYKSGRFSRDGIDKKLENLLPHKNGFYVELGANDGALASNSYYFELKKNWKGILIEPAPNLFLSRKKRRGKNNFVFCNACVPFDYKNEFVSMIYCDAMTISKDLDLDIENPEKFVLDGEKHLLTREETFSFGAKASTLNDLLLKGSAPNLIDFLSLDVEGAELEVLKGIDFEKFRFKYIVLESRNIKLTKSFLSNHSYELVERITENDYLFANKKKINI